MGLLCSFRFDRDPLGSDAYALVGLLSTIRSVIGICAKLGARHVYQQNEGNEFCKVVFKPKAAQTPTARAKRNAAIAAGRWSRKALEDDDRDEFPGLLITFRILYSFLSRVVWLRSDARRVGFSSNAVTLELCRPRI